MLNGPVYPVPPNPRLRFLSLGAGVQSTTLALMAAHGEFDVMPDCAIFADTQAEPKAVYEHLDWLRSGNVLPFPVHVVTAGSLRDELVNAARYEGNSWGRPPFFVTNQTGRKGRLRRQCTDDYKIQPIENKIRELLGLKPRQWWPKEPVVEQWMGISIDEYIRVKPTRRPALVRRYPLIEAGMTRRDCKGWLQRHDYPIPPKSACTFCPFHSTAVWRDMKLNDPDSFADAVAVDNAIRNGVAGVKAEQVFVHRSLKPLAEIDFDALAGVKNQGDLFGEECDGMCGV